jgi:protein O-GlcNAc transferase
MILSKLIIHSAVATCLAVVAGMAGGASQGALCVAQPTIQIRTARKDVELAEGLIAKGVAALARQEVAAARDYFEQALKANPKSVTAHTFLGVIADRSGALVEAERHFAAAALADPLSPSVRNNHGVSLHKLGRVEEAAAQFAASLRLDQSQPSALVNLAQIRFARGAPDDLRAARELFERAHAIAPDIETSRALTVIALRLKDTEAAAKYFREYSARLAGANSQAATTAARAELGAALLEAGLSREAVAELSAVVASEPSNAEAVVRLAKAHLALDELPSAGRTLEGAVARGLQTAPIYALLASVYEKSGHVENAIPAMRLAIERDPESEVYRFAYGMLLTSVLAPKAAEIRLKEALQLFPRSARLWLALGIAHFKAGINEEAAKALAHAIELDPKFAPAFAYLGMTRIEVGQYDEALKFYEQALAINEKMGVVDYLIADALQRKATPDAARIETHLVRAVKLEPAFAPARLALGKLYFRTDRLAEASSELERVTKLEPNLAEAYYQLGRLYGRMKRTAEAQAALATFKKLSEEQKEQSQSERREIVRRLADVRF